jgi:hypothetical protein
MNQKTYYHPHQIAQRQTIQQQLNTVQDELRQINALANAPAQGQIQ